jgi:hypothetical protein
MGNIIFIEDKNSGSILPYRAINKIFCELILQSIKEIKLSIASPSSYLKRQKINDVICSCKGLRILHMSFSDPIWNFEMHNKIIDGLHQIGSNCRDIEELSLKADYMQHTSKNLPSFPNLRRLT